MATCSECGSDLAEGALACANCASPARPQLVETQPVAWTILATQDNLMLGSSAFEYAVYDHDRTYGRWPNSPDGYRLASEAYGAYGQSRAHGVAYAATGYQDPVRLGLPVNPVVESRTYSAPLSFVGSTRRILGWTGSAVQRNPHLRVLLWIGTVLALLATWAFVAMWYLVVFGLFGIFMIPYRLIRRSQRKSLHVQQTALATQQAMFQQMSQMQQAQWPGPPASGYGPGPSTAETYAGNEPSSLPPA